TQTITDAATALTGAEMGVMFYSVRRLDGAGATTRYALAGTATERFDELALTMPRHTPLLAPTFDGMMVVRVDDVTQDPRYGKNPPHEVVPVHHPKIASYMAVPVIARSGKVIGSLLFGHARPDVFTERHERLVVGLAAHDATLLEHRAVYEAA